MCPPGTAAPNERDQLEQVQSQPGARRERRGQARADGTRSRLASTPGTATAASGIAAKLSTIPISATVPSAGAVIGAVASVAPTDDAQRAPPDAGPSARSVQRVNVVAPQSADAESQPPRSKTAHGSISRTAETGRGQQRVGPDLPLAQPATARSTTSAAARVAGAGQPRNAT